jgi:hypothetical protein
MTRTVLVLALAVALAACSSPSPAPAAAASVAPPVALPGGGTGFVRATLVGPLVPRIGRTPDGPELKTVPDGLPQPLEAGRKVVILGEPEDGPDGTWVRVWVEESVEVSPSDFYVWLAHKTRGIDRLVVSDPVPCPATATIGSLAALVQQDRLGCAGGTVITLDARTGRLPLASSYDVDPAWYGRNEDPITALFDPGPTRFGPDAITTPDQAGGWINARVPPGIPALPLGVYLRVTGRFDDPTAAGCVRRGGPFSGVPDEDPAVSVQWCREQFVVSGWEMLLGAEGRPFDPADPQLHRREFRLPPGAVMGCAGVGMPMLTIRIDPAQPIPVWVESGPQRRRSEAVFGPEFRLALNPLRVESTTGVTLVDREMLDPDRSKPGLSLCPGGDTISFDVLPAA